MWIEYEVKSVGNDEVLIAFKDKKRQFIFFGKKIEIIRQYRGSCTVWHQYPDAERCSSYLEQLLYKIWIKYQWKMEKSNPL